MIPPDVCLQYYRRKTATSAQPAALERACALARYAGIPAIAWHGGPRDLDEHWGECAHIAASHGLIAGAAWGLDGKHDVDGTVLTAREKGALMGHVLAESSCAFGLADAEGQWDTNAGPGDETTEAGALALGEELRKLAPHARVGDQCWFAIESHGDPRHIPLPIDRGGPFAGFPADEFAFSCVNWLRFRQAYCNDFTGKNRYHRVFDWMDKDWSQFDADLVRAGRADLVRPLGVTIQGYGWGDILPDLVECLLVYCGRLAQPVMVWCEPLPDAATIAAVMGFHALRDRGFVRATSAIDMVRAYQREYNRTAPADKQLTVDGRCGARTLASLGVKVA